MPKSSRKDKEPVPVLKNSTVVPYISAETSLPELTFKGLILGIVLAIILAGSNAYLGLKMGQTISASIPAAVISMTVLRMFRRSNILENNIVQTIASAGEVVAAGIIFTIPALVVMGYWDSFGYWQVTLIAIIGGILGIIFSVPLRRALIIESELKFPEGVATAEVLKAGAQSQESSGNKGVRFLLIGSIGASLVKFCQSGLHILGETISGWFTAGGAVFGFSNGLSLSMVGAGYIVGMKVCINLLIGSALAWLVGVPLYSFFSAGPQEFGLAADAAAFDFAMAIRAEKIRYIGVGGMVFGGIWALISLVGPIRSAISSSFDALKKSNQGTAVATIRTDYDIPMHYVLLGTLLISIPIFMMFNHVLTNAGLHISTTLYWITVSVLTLAALFVGFICSSIGGYMAGIVGSSANPISGITIGAILIVSLVIVLLLGGQVQFGIASAETISLAAVTIMIGGVVAVAASFGCDNLQDLKAGQLVGSTPWKQQLTLIVGAIAGAMVVAPILELLYQAYGIGGIFPRPGMDPAHALAAPQATLMASVATGIFEQTLDWAVVGIGVGIGIGILLIDRLILAPSGSEYRLSVLAIALGIYLPLDVVCPLVIGGIISFMGQRRLSQIKPTLPAAEFKDLESKTERQGLLLSAGLIAGDALVGILLAIPFAAYQSTNILAIVGASFEQTATILGVMVFLGFCYYMYLLGHQDRMKESA